MEKINLETKWDKKVEERRNHKWRNRGTHNMRVPIKYLQFSRKKSHEIRKTSAYLFATRDHGIEKPNRDSSCKKSKVYAYINHQRAGEVDI